MALLGVVFALGAGEALAQKYTLSASKSMTEGQSLVPVSVTLTAPAEVGRNKTVTITVSVTQLTDSEILASQGARLAVLESRQPPVTRAELNEGKVSVEAEDSVKLTGESDVQWMEKPNVIGDVEPNNSNGTATFKFDYGEDVIDITHTAYLRTNRDSADAEGELFRLEAKADKPKISATTGSVNVKINDVQTQSYVVNFPGDNDMTIDEGIDAGLELEAVPDRTVIIPFNVTLSSEYDVTDYSLDENPVAISENYSLGEDSDGNGKVGVTTPFTVNTKTVDGDRVDDTVTVTAQTTNQPGTQRTLAMFDLKVVDQHKLPKITLGGITIPDPADAKKKLTVTSIPEGTIGTVTLVADRGTTTDDVPDDEKITVALARADGSTASRADYTLNGSPVTIKPSPTKSGTFTLDVDADEDIGEESLLLMARVAGDPLKAYGPNPDEPYNLKKIDFTDATTKQIEPMTDEMVKAAVAAARTAGDADKNGLWTPSEKLMVMASDLFTFPATTSIVLGNITVAPAGVVSHSTTNAELTVTAMEAGTAMVTVTGTVTSESSSAIPQTMSNVAQVAFSITVDAPAIVGMPQADVNTAVTAAIKKAADMASSKQWESGGAMAMVELSKLFDVPASVKNVAYATRSSDEGDVMAAISGDNVVLTPKSAGTATITVTATDTDTGKTARVSFDATVMAQAAIAAKTQAGVDAVFMAAGAGSLVAEGPAVMVDMSMLFTVSSTAKPTYSAQSSMPAVLEASSSGMMATLTPMSAGSAMVTVTAVDSGSGSIAEVMYDATVGAAAITYMLSGPMDMNIAEGSSAMLTATASSAVPMDTEVMIMRDGASTAGMDDYEVAGMIMINAGATTGTTMVMATEDNMAEDMEMLTLYGMVGDMQLNAVTFTIWDAAVPALPLIAQLLLAAFLALGGYRRYLRR